MSAIQRFSLKYPVCSHHHLLLIGTLLFFHLAEASWIEAFKASKDKWAVLGCAHLLVNWFERARDACLLRRHILLLAVMVYIEEHLLVLKTGSLHEIALELDELVFTSGRARIKYKNNSVGALLDWTPTAFVAPISWYIPKFNVDLAEDAGRGRCIFLKLHNSENQKMFS